MKALPKWQSIENDREKYAAYLCSREWAVLKEAVHKRAGGKCERCRFFDINAVHHLTYERKYAETLDDLEGHCEHCHAFTHGKSDWDPVGSPTALVTYFIECKKHSEFPIPVESLCGCLPAEFTWDEKGNTWDLLPSVRLSIVCVLQYDALCSAASGLDSTSWDLRRAALDLCPFRFDDLAWYYAKYNPSDYESTRIALDVCGAPTDTYLVEVEPLDEED
jgi:hypothetical protein